MAPFIKNNRRLIFSLIGLVLLGAYFVFAYLIGPDRNIFALQLAYPETLPLRLSPADLKTLNDDRTGTWVRAELAARRSVPAPVKIRSRYMKSGLDFQIDLDGYVYHLFQLNKKRRPIHDCYQRLADPGFLVSSNRTVRLEINEVLIGIYVVERKIYEQLREEDGSYDLRIGDDTHFLRKLRLDMALGRRELLEKSFDLESLVNFIVFLHRLGFEPGHDLSRLIIHYNPRRERFVPLLTFESLLSGTDIESRSCQFLEEFEWDPQTAPRDGELEEIIRIFRDTEYSDLIGQVVWLGSGDPGDRL